MSDQTRSRTLAAKQNPAAPATESDLALHWQKQQRLALQQLESLAWPAAQREYERAYGLAEQLLVQSPCKNCAIKAYVRTLVEYALVLHKLGMQSQLGAIRAISLHSLQPLLGSIKATQLLRPLADIQRANEAQVELWLGRLMIAGACHWQKH